MHTRMLLAALAGAALAIPRPQTTAPQYAILDASNVDGEPFTGGMLVGKDGSVSNAPEEFVIGWAVANGSGLGLDTDAVFRLAAWYGVADAAPSAETLIDDAANYPCGAGPWTCALKVTPSMVDVKGTLGNGGWEVQFPRVDKTGHAVARVEVCACRNLPGWDAPGAPGVCPSDCSFF